MPDPRARLRAESSCRDGPWLACAYSKGLALGPPWAPGPSGVVSGGFGACSQSSSLGACRFVAPCLAQIAVTALPLVRLVQLASGLWGVAAAPLLWRRFTRQVGTPGGQGGGDSPVNNAIAQTLGQATPGAVTTGRRPLKRSVKKPTPARGFRATVNQACLEASPPPGTSCIHMAPEEAVRRRLKWPRQVLLRVVIDGVCGVLC